MNYYYIKLSCPAVSDEFHFGGILTRLIDQTVFSETITRVANKLPEASIGDLIFFHIGGDAGNKDRYFRGVREELREFTNGVFGFGILEQKDVEEKSLVAQFYGFRTPVSKLDLYFYPQFIDNLGPLSKGTPNQAGLYDLSPEIALSFIDYIKLNNNLGIASSILNDIDSNGFLTRTGIEAFNQESAFRSLNTSTFLSILSQPLPRINSPQIQSKGNIALSEFYNTLTLAGILFHETIIDRFVVSLLTKPFVILTGLSGSGKTKLAQAFAIWICEKDTDFCIIPVGADWTNREPLLGYPDALKHGSYVKPDNGLLDLILEASLLENQQKPYFLILDEMNLSHVERYFADFLSVMETGESFSLHPNSADWKEPSGLFIDGIPDKIKLPPNFFIIGTVNIDETTYMFSPKVLDRANVIEFRVTENEMDEFLKNPVKPDFNSMRSLGVSMAADFIRMANEEIIDFEDKALIKEILIDFFNELKKSGSEFGYRTSSEIFRFVALFKKLTVAENRNYTTNEIIDTAILQKLLPKLHGSKKKLDRVLISLAKLCFTNDEPSAIDALLKQFEANPERIDQANEVRFKLSLEKILRMKRRADQDGFTSFAEA